MIIKRSIKFDLEKRAGKEAHPVRMRVSYSGNRIGFVMGIHVEEKQFDKENEKVIGHKDAKKINQEINIYWQNIEDIFSRYELIEKRIPEPIKLREEFNISIGKGIKDKTTEDNLFLSVFNEFIDSEGVKNHWSIQTKWKFETIRDQFIEANKNIPLNSLSEKHFINFISLMERKEYRNSTTAKRVSQLKQFFRWARNHGFYSGAADEVFKTKLKGSEGLKPVIHLTWEELLYLYDYKFHNERLEKVRDVFCFCCFTSLRYSDVSKLSRDDIKGSYFTIITQKTVDALKIELNDYSNSILEKYKDLDFPKNQALPIISDVKMNTYLKEIGKIIGLTESQKIVYFVGNKRYEEVYPKYELLTTHCGRRTFVVNALYLGIPAEVVMKWTGHSDFKAMKPYVKIVDALKSESMNKFNTPKSTPEN